MPRPKNVRMTGRIKKLIRDKGFGFIQAADRTELFFHRTNVEAGAWDALMEGMEVSFVAVDSMKGPRAEQVMVADES